MREERRALGILRGKVGARGRDNKKDEYRARVLGILKDKVLVEQQQQHMRDGHGALGILKGKVGAWGKGINKDEYGVGGPGILKDKVLAQ